MSQEFDEETIKDLGTIHSLSDVIMLYYLEYLIGICLDVEDTVDLARQKSDIVFENLTLKNGLPCTRLLVDLLDDIDPKHFQAFLNKYNIAKQNKSNDDFITQIDTYIHEYGYGFCLYKADGIMGISAILDLILLKNKVVVLDATSITRMSAKKIIDREGNYLFLLQNYSPLYEEIKSFFSNIKKLQMLQNEKEQCIFESETDIVCTKLDWIPKYKQFPNIKAVGMIQGETEEDNAYYITSLSDFDSITTILDQHFWDIDLVSWNIDILKDPKPVINTDEKKIDITDLNLKVLKKEGAKVLINAVKQEYNVEKKYLSELGWRRQASLDDKALRNLYKHF